MKPIRKIVILGGGTAGWMSAAMLSNQISKDHCKIELVESEQIGNIGVGESTIPAFMSLLKLLGIDELDFISKTQASFKLGIKFSDWYTKGESFFHPFGRMTAGTDDASLFQYWLRCVLSNDPIKLLDFSVSNVMAKHHKFMHHSAVDGSPIAEARHALHLDASLMAKYMRDYAEARGVKRREGKVAKVITEGEEKILALKLENGKTIEGDLFIDCSGFRALLIGDALKVPYEDWSKYLPCDRAVTVLSEAIEDTPPYTHASAKDSGWIWTIPLQRRTGNGYVYASEYCSDDEATHTLKQSIQGKLLNEPRIIPFKTGIREQFWKGNCVSVGLAAGFIEPLESTAIHLAMRGIAELLQQFPDLGFNTVLHKEYNRKLRQEYEDVRDFIILHYYPTKRDDSPLWRYCSSMEIPESLRDKIEYYRAQGTVPLMPNRLFDETSWRPVCEGMKIRPKSYSLFIQSMDYKTIKQHMLAYAKNIEDAVKQLPSHSEFLERHCAAVSD